VITRPAEFADKLHDYSPFGYTPLNIRGRSASIRSDSQLSKEKARRRGRCLAKWPLLPPTAKPRAPTIRRPRWGWRSRRGRGEDLRCSSSVGECSLRSV